MLFFLEYMSQTILLTSKVDDYAYVLVMSKIQKQLKCARLIYECNNKWICLTTINLLHPSGIISSCPQKRLTNFTMNQQSLSQHHSSIRQILTSRRRTWTYRVGDYIHRLLRKSVNWCREERREFTTSDDGSGALH